MSISFLLRGAPLRTSTDAPRSITKASTMTWSTRLSTMLRVDGAPDSLNTGPLISMVVAKAATSHARDKFDLQILDARLREIEDAQNCLVVHAVVSGQKKHALLRGPAAQDLSHARGQFGRSDLLLAQGHATVGRKTLPCRGPEDATGRGGDDQDQPQFLGLRGHGIGRAFRDVDVIALHEEWNDHHEDDQQHEHYVDERRDVDLRLQIRSGIASVELHNFTLPASLCCGPWRSGPPPGSRPARSPAWPLGPGGS